MGFEQRITCDREGCTVAAAAPGYECGPEGWLRLSPGSVSESTKDFCSMDCLAEWAAAQVGKGGDDADQYEAVAFELTGMPGNPLTTNLNGPQHWRPSDATLWNPLASATACIPTATGVVDLSQPFGCWPANIRQ